VFNSISVGIGELRLPLSVEDTSRLQGVCEQAPFGLLTVVDTNIRRWWQSDSSNVTFHEALIFVIKNIQLLPTKAVCALGFNGEVLHLEAHLYKLLFNI
jgi:hypothetical protein